MLRTAKPCGLAIFGIVLCVAVPTRAEEFRDWLSELRAEALERGISEATVTAELGDVVPIPEVIELDRHQPRKPQDYCTYMRKRLTPTRIDGGRRALVEHAELLAQLQAEYGVPPRYLAALWGLETNFGDFLGDFPVVGVLVTLAHDHRRGADFREQIFAALRILDENQLSTDAFRGSWAGAIGQVQFMPTTYLEYAVDHDGDGRKDLWTSVPDSLASAANYLRESGWRPGESWGRRVQLPAQLEDRRELARARSLPDWQVLGVRRFDGGALPNARLTGSIVLPRRTRNPAFLVYHNYRTILTWNRSTFFALSVGALADRISGRRTSPTCGV